MTFIDSIKTPSRKITLTEYDPPSPELLLTDGECITIGFLDTETTGIDRHHDKIIELAIKVVTFEKSSCEIVSIDQVYESFNDPDEDIGHDITLLTGINNDMVEGQSIDWKKVDEIFQFVEIIVAHNAGFDRAFMDRYSLQSPKKLWGCSVNDIDWLSRGFSSAKQELLCYWHGFYFNAHRAMSDVDSLIHLVTHNFYGKDRPLIELIEKSQSPSYIIFADNFKYDPIKKDILKGNKYRWNNKQKIWYKSVKLNDIDEEKDWLTATIYGSYFEGKVQEVNPIDKYKL